MGILVIDPFDTSPFSKLILDRLWFNFPTVTTNLGDNRLVGMQLATHIFCPISVRFAVEHEWVQRTHDFAWNFAFINFFSALFDGSIDVCFSVDHGCFHIVRQLAQWPINSRSPLLCLASWTVQTSRLCSCDQTFFLVSLFCLVKVTLAFDILNVSSNGFVQMILSS